MVITMLDRILNIGLAGLVVMNHSRDVEPVVLGELILTIHKVLDYDSPGLPVRPRNITWSLAP
jgi:hypothetical protein